MGSAMDARPIRPGLGFECARISTLRLFTFNGSDRKHKDDLSWRSAAWWEMLEVR